MMKGLWQCPQCETWWTWRLALARSLCSVDVASAASESERSLSVTGRAVDVLVYGNFLCGRITSHTMRCGMSAARGTEDSGKNEM